MNFDDYGRMLVIVDGQIERRAIDYVQPHPAGHGLHQFVPVLHQGEMAVHTLEGNTYIFKTGL